jgi:biotin-dependent carboxylase-like uncharacterized protein
VSDVLRVVRPGLLTTVQDLGRPGAIASGVTPGGAMDRFAHRAANLLVGNEEGAATLECTLKGPHLVAAHPCVVAVTGGDLDARINGHPAPGWTGVLLSAGDELTLEGRRAGGRAYLGVAGGIESDRWLGSGSTNLMAARGGMHGRPLTGGDVIRIAAELPGPTVAGRHLAENLRPGYADRVLHLIPGPHIRRLGADGRRLLFGSIFKISHDANRMGYKLDGPALEAPGDEILSFGLVAGVVQLPPGGRPILLMADHQTAGGYAVVATVAGASLPVAAQLVPGDEVRFAEISMEAALRMRADQRAALDSLMS